MTAPPLEITLEIETDRLTAELDRLAGFSDAPAPAVTRVLWTDPDLRARVWLTGLFEEAGLAVRQDTLGNLFARWDGTDMGVEAVGTGSHTDAVPQSGRYDGTLGVLGALEALRALKRAGFRPRRALEVLMFTSEEPTRFGLGCLGSRVLSGAMPPEAVAALHDGDGISVEDARRAAGCTGNLSDVRLPEGYYSAFVELHIEQGPLLEAEGLDIGIVTAIAAPAALRVRLEGEGGHAGGVLMPGRRDAGLAAAEVALAVEAAALASGGADTVATTGVFQVHPGAVNSIPRRADLEIDVRDTDGARRDRVVAEILRAAEEIGRRRRVAVHAETINADPPAKSGPTVVEAAQDACTALGLSWRPMVSRAYHDSLFMARIAPTGMIFIPCRGGWSHRPDEYSSPEQIARGVAVLAHTLGRLAA